MFESVEYGVKPVVYGRVAMKPNREATVAILVIPEMGYRNICKAANRCGSHRHGDIFFDNHFAARTVETISFRDYNTGQLSIATKPQFQRTKD